LEQEPQVEGGLQLGAEEGVALIKRIEGGDASALATLYDKTSRLLHGLISRISGDKALAEEILLDVYTQIWKHADSYDPKITPLEWLMTVARIRAVAVLHWNRLLRRRYEISSGTLDSIMTVSPEEQRMARSNIESLVPVQREILNWVYFSGLSCSEIAALIGKPLGAIRTHARLSMSKLDDLFRPLFEQK
jgi:RNA polymerase sigma-70 factor (ECF subfamily)